MSKSSFEKRILPRELKPLYPQRFGDCSLVSGTLGSCLEGPSQDDGWVGAEWVRFLPFPLFHPKQLHVYSALYTEYRVGKRV